MQTVGKPVRGLTDNPKSLAPTGQSSESLLTQILNYVVALFKVKTDEAKTSQILHNLGINQVVKVKLSHSINHVVANVYTGGVAVYLADNSRLEPDFVVGGANPAQEFTFPTAQYDTVTIKNINPTLVASGQIHFCKVGK